MICHDCYRAGAGYQPGMVDGNGAAIAELQGAWAAAPMAGDVDLFTGEAYTAPAPRRKGGDDRQLSMF